MKCPNIQVEMKIFQLEVSSFLGFFLFSLPTSRSHHLPVWSLADTPFYLPTGEPYRDLLTVNTAKIVADLYGENIVGSSREERFDLFLHFIREK